MILPSPPKVPSDLSRGSRCVFLGDSITIADENQNELASNAGGGRVWNWYATLYSDGAILPTAPSTANDETHNAGVSGNTSADALARVQSDVIAHRPDKCFVMLGTNDAGTSTSLTTYAANITAIANRLKNARIMPIFVAPPPRHDNPTYQATVTRYCAWLSHFCAANDYAFVDPRPTITRASDGNFITGYHNGDGVHPSPKGAREIGKAVAEQAGHLFLANPYLVTALNDNANLLQNGVFTGDSNADGAADSWTLNASGGITPTIETATHGNWQVITRSAGGAGVAAGSVNQNATTGFSAGDRIAAAAVITSSGLDTGGGQAYVRVRFQGTSESMDLAWALTTDVPEHVAYREGVVPVGTTGVRMFIGFLDNTGTGVLKVARATILNLTALGLA